MRTESEEVDDEEYQEPESGVVKVLKNRTIFLCGEISQESSSDIMTNLISMSQDNSDPITLYLSTFGGDIYESLSIYDIIKSIKAPVHTVGIGKVISSGVFLLAIGEPGYRKIGKNTRLMWHCASFDFAGNLPNHKIEQKETEEVERLMDKILSKCSKMPKKVKKEILSGKDVYFSAAQAIKYGIADSYL